VIVKGGCLAGFLARHRRRHRSLQPMKHRSRDRRCPSGSGWGKALAKREAPPVNAGRSLARETSAGDRHCSRQAQAARPRLSLKPKPRGGGPASNRGREAEAGVQAMRARRRPPYRVSTSRARAPGASGARERTLGEGGRLRLPGLGACSQVEPAAHGGIGRSRGRARGLFGLQKSTSGAWSRSRGHGSSPLALPTGGSVGKAAPEAGSQWREPRAREQRATRPVTGSL